MLWRKSTIIPFLCPPHKFYLPLAIYPSSLYSPAFPYDYILSMVPHPPSCAILPLSTFPSILRPHSPFFFLPHTSFLHFPLYSSTQSLSSRMCALLPEKEFIDLYFWVVIVRWSRGFWWVRWTWREVFTHREANRWTGWDRRLERRQEVCSSGSYWQGKGDLEQNSWLWWPWHIWVSTHEVVGNRKCCVFEEVVNLARCALTF